MSRRDSIETDHYDATHGERRDEDGQTRREAALDDRRRDPASPLDDPMFGALHLLARDQEELARLAYGDGPVDSALARIAEEEGL